MGEHKIPKTPPKRPGSQILGMRSAISGWKSQAMGSDPDTDDFMRALEKVIAWVDELEAATEPFAKVVPLLDPMASDDDKVLLIGPGLKPEARDDSPALTVGAFRRLNPGAVAMAAQKPLN